MSDPNNSSDIISYILTACVAGVGWLFKTVFDHNKEMVSQIVSLQKDTIKTQTLTKDALLKTHDTIEALKTELATNTEIQRDILATMQQQQVTSDPRKIIVSQGQKDTAKKPTTFKRKHNTQMQGDTSLEKEEAV
jgi:hypothetical protein